LEPLRTVVVGWFFLFFFFLPRVFASKNHLCVSLADLLGTEPSGNTKNLDRILACTSKANSLFFGETMDDATYEAVVQLPMQARVKVLSLDRLWEAQEHLGDGLVVSKFANDLAKNSDLEQLDLACNKLGDAAAIALSQALRSNKNLLSLNLSFNLIASSGVKAIAAALEQDNQSLQNLNLDENKIEEIGANALGEMLQTNQGLHCLSVISALVVCEPFLSKLPMNKTLQRLNLAQNNLADAGAVQLAQILSSNEGLVHLDISGNAIEDPGAQAIFQALENNKFLQVLIMESNYCRDHGANALATLLRQTNIALQNVNLNWNFITKAGLQSISESTQNQIILLENNYSW